MGFCRASTWKERGRQLNVLRSRCDEIITKLGVRKEDARAQGMMHIRQFCSTIAGVPIRLAGLAERRDGLCVVNAALGSRDNTNTKSLLTDLNNNSKCAFLALVQFALENMANRVLEGIGQKLVGRFKPNVKKLMELTEIADMNAKLDLVCVPQYIRNTLHNNGVHTHSNCSFDVDGEEYVFERGEDIRCGTWSHVFHAVSCALDVYAEIMLSTKVTGVEDIAAS